jgi:RNA polymerase sigma factor for flagellar operon FliA
MTVAEKLGRAQAMVANPVDYLPMVQRVARKLVRRLPHHIELGDLVSAGVVGLMEAMQRYDPSRETVFVRYAEFRVRGAMLDELRRRDLMARDARSEAKQIEQACEDWRRAYGYVPEEEQLAGHLGITVQVLRDRLARLAPVQVMSLDDCGPFDPRSMTLGAFEIVSDEEEKMQVVHAIGLLAKREQQILHLYYREELTLKEIGTILGVSESRVSQMMTKATLQIRGMVRASRIKEENA